MKLTCGLDADAQIVCHGTELAQGAPEGRFLDVSPYDDGMVCAVNDQGEFGCWSDALGWQDDGWATAEMPTGTWMALGTDVSGATLIDSHGDVWRWVSHQSARRVLAANGDPYVSSQSRGSSGCALRETGAVDCWGEWEGLEPESRFKQISLGCGVTVDGAIECWDDSGAPAVLEVP